MSWVSIGVAAVGVGTSVVKGISEHKKEKAAKAEADRLKTPYFQVQDQYYQNRNIAEQMAGGGFAQGEKDQFTSQSERGLGTSLSTLLSVSSDPNQISQLFDNFARSTGQFEAADASQHLKNIEYFTQANKDIAGQQTTQWGINEYQPYENKLKEITQRRAAAETNQWNAVSEGIGAAGAIGTSLSNAALMKKLFGNQAPFVGTATRSSVSQGVQASSGINTSANLPALNPASLEINTPANEQLYTQE